MNNGLLSVFLFVIISFLSFIGSGFAGRYAERFGIVDDPQSDPTRKYHHKPIPLMGATGLVLVSLCAMIVLYIIAYYDVGGVREFFSAGLYYKLDHYGSYLWIVVAALLLMIAGYLDDTGSISVLGRFALTGTALGITVVLGGLRINALSYPFDTLIPAFVFLPELLAFVWIGFCLFTTKVLDGHDGLVTSVGVVGYLTIASVALFTNVNQPLIYLFGIIWAAGLLGFLPFNFPNARVYLGDGGSMIIGYMIGVLSLLAGAKIATAGSVIGWFVIDLLFVWLRRVLDKRNPLTSSDRYHWHQRLSDSGLNKLQVLAVSMIAVLTTSRIGLMISTQNKLIVLVSQCIALLMIFGITYTWTHYKIKR